MKIVFMGTPDFSVPCLQALHKAGYTVSAVFTQPDKARGRKQILTPPPVKEAAVQLGIPVLQPNTLRDASVLEALCGYQPDLIVVVAYGKLLPPPVLAAAKYGCINVHASLLPKFRGASPIQSAILAGETETGVTTMQMAEGIDTGDILLQTPIQIENTDTAESLFHKLSIVGADLLLQTLEKVEIHSLVPEKQDEEKATYCTVLSRESGRIDYRQPAQTIVNQVRGLYPWPAAYFTLNQTKFKVLAAEFFGKTDAPAGTLSADERGLQIACGDGNAVTVLEIQPEGKKRMPAKAFLNGFKLTKGLKLDGESETTGS